ncbi:MAG TPA: Na/Pi cotransporter family protein, partial [Gammaproteobacteria bacterium]|nr:Na/Pi cotransporter family protein [Gammaproteobacteria bacterium]
MTALEITSIAISLIGGLAIFLYGMKVMTESLTLVAGRRMKLLLSKLTRNRFTAALAGAMVTAIIQSSSVTTVLIVSFITAGLMSFTQSIGMILGANVGTTITAQIIAFKVTKAAMLMIAFGFFTELLASNRRVKYLATMMLGLGLLFLGMNLMSQATEPLKSLPSFIALMRDIQNPLAGILIGATFTALVQSSSATTGIIIILASQGFISLEAGIALVMGANIGTCVTAILSAIGKPREAVQAAVVHVVFNVLGVLLWVWFIPQLAQLVQEISPSSPQLQGAARLAADAPRQIANAHTLFNVVAALVFLPFLAPFARLCERLVPDRPLDESGGITPRFLDDEVISIPAFALERARFEIARMGGYVEDML